MFTLSRALAPTLPSEEDFPYTIRVESLVTESNGSSSMASVCGGCLALMDAGVPIKSPIAGIAMGECYQAHRTDFAPLFAFCHTICVYVPNFHDSYPTSGMLLGGKGGVSDENAVIVSDILGTEDALGTMDFKVAGNREGITTFQLDIKCEGLTLETMEKALEQAKAGRLHILDEMEKALKEPRPELPRTVPKLTRMIIPEESIGKVIGPGGRQIRALIEDFDLVNIDVEENGEVQLTGFNLEQMEKAKELITLLTGSAGGKGKGERIPKSEYIGPEPIEGATYKGKITGIHNFGVFLEILPGAEDGSTPGLEGLCHVSELHIERVRNCEGFIKGMNTETLEGRFHFSKFSFFLQAFFYRKTPSALSLTKSCTSTTKHVVVYLGKNQKGQHQLSRKALLEERGVGGKKSGRGGRRGDGSKQNENDKPSASEMSQEEIDIIAQAIEGISEL